MLHVCFRRRGNGEQGARGKGATPIAHIHVSRDISHVVGGLLAGPLLASRPWQVTASETLINLAAAGH